MALHESDREDLVRDGRNMPWRGSCRVEGVELVVGFRSRGQASLYGGVDPVFQFNASGELRRVYFQSRRYIASRGRLASLTRNSRGGRVEFEEQLVDEATRQAIDEELMRWLAVLRESTKSVAWRAEGEPVDSFLERVKDWLDRLPPSPVVADQPNA